MVIVKDPAYSYPSRYAATPARDHKSAYSGSCSAHMRVGSRNVAHRSAVPQSWMSVATASPLTMCPLALATYCARP